MHVCVCVCVCVCVRRGGGGRGRGVCLHLGRGCVCEHVCVHVSIVYLHMGRRMHIGSACGICACGKEGVHVGRRVFMCTHN